MKGSVPGAIDAPRSDRLTACGTATRLVCAPSVEDGLGEMAGFPVGTVAGVVGVLVGVAAGVEALASVRFPPPAGVVTDVPVGEVVELDVCTTPFEDVAALPPPSCATPVDEAASFPPAAVPIGSVTVVVSPAAVAEAVGVVAGDADCTAPVELEALFPPPT